MRNKIKPRRTSTKGKKPGSQDIDDGEIAVNSTDALMFINDAGQIKAITSPKASDTDLKKGYFDESSRVAVESMYFLVKRQKMKFFGVI